MGIREAALRGDEGLSGASAQDAVGDIILGFGRETGAQEWMTHRTALPSRALLGTARRGLSSQPVLREREGG